MESARKKLKEGLISEAEYTQSAVMSTIKVLHEENCYRVLNMLGSGSYGFVFDVEHPRVSSVAAKIVLKEFVSERNIQEWRSLRHENILPLLAAHYSPSTYTYAFLMPKYPAALDLLLEEDHFTDDFFGLAFERATSWLEHVLKGVSYLHGRKFCHLDLKLSNVLITESDRAVICDFDSLTYTEADVEKYASPFIFRPPEALVTKDNKLSVVNGFKFDIWTVGILGIELFTKHSISKSPEWYVDDPKWKDVMYPRLFHILQKKIFKSLVRSTFRNSKFRDEKIESIANFVKGCMQLNPRARPTAKDALNHAVFGGSVAFEPKANDVWRKRATSNDIDSLMSLFTAQAASVDTSIVCDQDASPIVNETVENEPKEVLEEYANVGEPAATEYMNETKIAEKCDSPVKLSKKQKILRWAAKKRASFNKTLNRMFPKLRK